jgi:hypothetical protein
MIHWPTKSPIGGSDSTGWWESCLTFPVNAGLLSYFLEKLRNLQAVVHATAFRMNYAGNWRQWIPPCQWIVRCQLFIALLKTTLFSTKLGSEFHSLHTFLENAAFYVFQLQLKAGPRCESYMAYALLNRVNIRSSEFPGVLQPVISSELQYYMQWIPYILGFSELHPEWDQATYTLSVIYSPPVNCLLIVTASEVSLLMNYVPPVKYSVMVNYS